MATLLKQLLAAGVAALAACAFCAPVSATETNHPKATTVLKNQAKAKAKAKSKKADKAEAAAPAEPEPDLTDTVSTDYNCELGNKVTIYANEHDDTHIALRWQKRLHRLERVSTTTGAQRFENSKFGLIWIGIPSKGILLDSKLNRQLANDCKNATQAHPVAGA
jgi:membrane-bound inhibitor of C-type lysozyme